MINDYEDCGRAAFVRFCTRKGKKKGLRSCQHMRTHSIVEKKKEKKGQVSRIEAGSPRPLVRVPFNPSHEVEKGIS